MEKGIKRIQNGGIASPWGRRFPWPLVTTALFSRSMPFHSMSKCLMPLRLLFSPNSGAADSESVWSTS